MTSGLGNSDDGEIHDQDGLRDDASGVIIDIGAETLVKESRSDAMDSTLKPSGVQFQASVTSASLKTVASYRKSGTDQLCPLWQKVNSMSTSFFALSKGSQMKSVRNLNGLSALPISVRNVRLVKPVPKLEFLYDMESKRISFNIHDTSTAAKVLVGVVGIGLIVWAAEVESRSSA